MASVMDKRPPSGLLGKYIAPAARDMARNASPMDFLSLPLQALFHSGNAEAALFPASLTRTLRAQGLEGAGKSPRDIIRELGMVHDGRGWNEFERDIIDPKGLAAMKASSGFPNSPNASSITTLGKTNPNISPQQRAKYNQAMRETGVSRRTEDQLGRGTEGAYYPDMGEIFLNKSLSDEGLQRIFRHEGQHALDNTLGRTSGTSPERMMTNENPFFNKNPDKYSDYAHNTGEIRARLNEKLNAMYDTGANMVPGESRGLESIFGKNTPYKPERVWGD